MDDDTLTSEPNTSESKRHIVLRLLLLLVVCTLTAPYLLLPHYDFAPALPFHGTRWHNPYAEITDTWLKANFHAHAKAWSGTTDGTNSPAHIDSVYRSMHYDVASLSNYFSIDRLTTYSDNAAFVPCYEHGFSIQKSHRLMIGAKAVSWFDVFTPQTVHIKQFLIHNLTKDCDVLALAHPAFGRPSYTIGDAQQLCDYPCMEVLNHYRNSLLHWDAALSAGRRVYLVADDDSHNADESGETGVRWTMLNVRHAVRSEITEALRTGRTFGVMGHRGVVDVMPTSIEVTNDTLEIACDKPFRQCRLIGQNGLLLQSDSNSARVRYGLRSSDCYVRAEIETDSCTLFLNPVTREDAKQTVASATMNIPMTVLKIFTFALLSACLAYLLLFRPRRVVEAMTGPS